MIGGVYLTAYIGLRICGTGLDLNEITQKLGVVPAHSYKQGDTYDNKYTKSKIVYREDCWIADSEIKIDRDLEQVVGEFFAPYLIQSQYISGLAKMFSVSVYLSVYPESMQYAFLMSEKVISTLHSLGATMEIKVADLREFYEGEYKS